MKTFARESNKNLASRAKHLIWIQEKIQTADGEGGFNDVWTNVKQLWAEVSPIQAKQVFQYRSISVDASHFVKIRGYAGITEYQRIDFGGRYLEILAIENIQESDFELFLTCKEVRQ